MIEHLLLCTIPSSVPQDEVEDLIASLRGLKGKVPSIVDITAGTNFSERSGGYTHGLSVRFHDKDGLKEYLEHPEHRVVAQKLRALATDRVVVDYES